MEGIECGGFIFTANFDSGNLSQVELVPPKVDLPGSRPDKQEPPDYEFNIWTRPDCMGSEFENGNRTWFYFGIRLTPKELAVRKSRPSKKGSFKYSPASTLVPISEPSALIKFNLVNMNKQAKLYAQGMAPVFRILPGRPNWERIRDRPAYMQNNGNFAISFKYRMVDNPETTTYFAFTYPYTYEELQEMLQSIDDRFGLMSPYSYRNSSKNTDPEKQIQCEIDKKKPLIVKLTNQFKNKRKSFSNRRGNESSSIRSRSSMEKLSLPDVCVQEVFKNCTNMDQESEHLLNKMTLEQTISKISEPSVSHKKIKKISTSIIRDVTRSTHSKNLKTILPPTFSDINIDTTDGVQSSLNLSAGGAQLSHSNPETSADCTGIPETFSSPEILLKNSAVHTSVPANADEISGKYRPGELSPEMAVHVARHPDDIYYCRELLIKTIQDRRVDLLTITSYRNISLEREERLPNLFPEMNVLRPHKFLNKKIIFLSARVHPGETPSSFVLRGFLVSLLDRTCPVAATLRRMYVFKIIPFLNPDGVVLGHYRTDSRGCNLNRVYDAPDRWRHPSVYAARALVRYYHSEYPLFFADASSSMSKCKPGLIRPISTTPHRRDSGVSGLSDAISLRETTNLMRAPDPMTPLRKLQDTLRASIDLMSRRVDVSDRNIASTEQAENSDPQNDSSQAQHHSTPLWCEVCLASVYKLEVSMPGIRNIVPCMTSQNAHNRIDTDHLTITNQNTTIGVSKITGAIDLTDLSSDNINTTPNLRKMQLCNINMTNSNLSSLSSGNTNTPTSNMARGLNTTSGITDTPNSNMARVLNTSSGNTNTHNSNMASGSFKMSGVAGMAADVANMAAGIANVATDIANAASGIANLASGLANNRNNSGVSNTMNIDGNIMSRQESDTTMASDVTGVSNFTGVSHITGTSNVTASGGGSSGLGSGSDSGFSGGVSYDRICRNCRLRTIREHSVDKAQTRPSSGGSSGDDSTATPPRPPVMANWLLTTEPEIEPPDFDQETSGLFLYVDMHGHASKRGIFMYGNHISGNRNRNSSLAGTGIVDPNVTVHELPKVMAVNSLHFHYTACNFSERNMYVKDRRDGSSREGCGRVSVWKQTGLLRSYTLECNYNTGRCVNVLPPTARHGATTSSSGNGSGSGSSTTTTTTTTTSSDMTTGGSRRLRGGGVPPKYGPGAFEEVGRALGPSILDLTDSNPRSRLGNSEYRSMRGVRESLYKDLTLDLKVCLKENDTASNSSRVHKTLGSLGSNDDQCNEDVDIEICNVA